MAQIAVSSSALMNPTKRALVRGFFSERRAEHRAFLLLILFRAFFPFYVGCGGKRDSDHKELQGTSMHSDRRLNHDNSLPLRWTLGPTADSDAARDVVFRGASRALGSSSQRQPKSVLSRPLIQGSPDAILIGDDGCQFVGGSFSGIKDFDTGPGLDLRESVAAEDGFVTCFDRSGKYRWTTTFGAKQQIEVRGLALSHGALYAVCDEHDGHVAVLAMDAATGAAKPGFGISGCQMFRCGQIDCAGGIRCQDDAIFVPIRCVNLFGERGSTSFTVVVAMDRSSGSAVTSFGASGIQTIGNASASTDSLPGLDSVEPMGIALSRSSIYIVGHCLGSNLGIGRHDEIIAGQQPRAFIAAISSKSGAAASSFGQSGVVLMEGNARTANGAVIVGDSLYLTGTCRERSRERAFVAMLNADTGAPAQQFGTAGIRVFGSWEWQGGCSIQVDGAMLYVAGGYIRQQTGGVFLAAFDRTNGFPVTTFADKGVRLIEGLFSGEQGQVEAFGEDLYLVAGTVPSLENDKHEVKVGNVTLKKGEISGFLFRFSKDGTLLDK